MSSSSEAHAPPASSDDTTPDASASFSPALIAVYVLIGLVSLLIGTSLLHNPSASVPVGWYLAIPDALSTLERGDVVQACPPDGEMSRLARERGYLQPSDTCPSGLQPLLKYVLGMPGDTVRVAPSGVTVNGVPVQPPPIRRDSYGRPVADAQWGLHALEPSQYWLGSEAPTGIDSRYFGPFTRSQLRQEALPVYVSRPE